MPSSYTKTLVKGKPIDDLVLWWIYHHEGTIRDLAKSLEVTSATIYYWLNHGEVPIKYLRRIEKMTCGEFNRERMRPDVFGEKD